MRIRLAYQVADRAIVRARAHTFFLPVTVILYYPSLSFIHVSFPLPLQPTLLSTNASRESCLVCPISLIRHLISPRSPSLSLSRFRTQCKSPWRLRCFASFLHIATALRVALQSWYHLYFTTGQLFWASAASRIGCPINSGRYTSTRNKNKGKYDDERRSKDLSPGTYEP